MVHKGMATAIILILFIASAGCTVYEKEDEYEGDSGLYDTIIQTIVDPVRDLYGDAASEPTPTSVSSEVPIIVKPAEGYSVEHFTPEITAASRPEETMSIYTPVYSERYSLLYRINGPYGLEIICNEAPFRITFESDPEYEDPRLSYAYWQLTTIETGDLIETGGFSLKHSTEKEQIMTIRDTGRYHLNLYGARIDVKVIISSQHAGGIAIVPIVPDSGPEYDEYW
ncbi:MAG: hypothetical protein Q7J09_09480 [Methanocalculus sp.]|nr:hypothetical protein [Methanocalculus sp.]